MKKNIFIICAFLLSLVATRSEAANQVFVEPDAVNKGVFYLKAVDFVDVDGVEVEMEYDATALANPRITQGEKLASTMFIPNPRLSARSIKIAAMSLSTIKGSGVLATITFDLKGTAPGNLTVSRRKISVAASSASTGTGTTGTGTTGTGSTGTGSTGTGPLTASDPGFVAGSVTGSVTNVTGGGASLGTITLPSDQMASSERKPEYQPLVTDLRKDMTIPAAGSESPQAVAAKPAAEDIKSEQSFLSFKSVLQLFKEFKGERNSKTLIALFADAKIPDFTQEPAVAIADGKNTVKLTLILKPSSTEPPKFIMQGANVKQLSREGDDVKWIIEVLPKKGVTEAKLTVMDGNKMMELPLTVAPPVNLSLIKAEKVSEADFSLYLAKPAKYDLNMDGKFDAIDDFIYTANYIVTLKIKPEKLPTVVKEQDKKATIKPAAKDESAVKKLPATKNGKNTKEGSEGKE